jgi:hypothetical protein
LIATNKKLANEEIELHVSSRPKPVMKVINRLKMYESGIVADNLIEFCESKIFRRKYPGKNRVKNMEAVYLSQFINGIFAHSNMEPS